MSYIIAIETALPQYRHQQSDIADFFINTTENKNTKRKIKFVSDKSGIARRYSVINDFSTTQNNYQLFDPKKSIASLEIRMNLYRQEALQLSLQAIKKIKNFDTIKSDITHIISITCTGLFAPGLDIELMRELDLKNNTARCSINFMGCNAAILGLKQAKTICDSVKNATVLIVCVELCTIHFQHNNTDDTILSNALFGDGAAASIVSNKPKTIKNNCSLKINSSNSLIIPKGFNDMAWQLSNTGFLMNLTSYVSELINGNMAEFLKNSAIDINSINYWAIHPGGKKIIDDFANTLQLDKNELQASYNVLKEFGNMSSPTILFVLKKLLEQDTTIKANETIFAAAFGPGISLETMQLEYILH